MKRTTLILTTTVSALTVLYHLNSQNFLAPVEQHVAATQELESPPSLVLQKPAKSAVANPDVWNLTPVVPLGQMLSLKEMFKPAYTLVKNGRIQTLQRSDRPNESWELQGIAMRGTEPRALLYNAGSRKMKNAGMGDTVDEQLVVKYISSGSITLEAKDNKKPQLFELRLFNTQKDTYAIKRKTP